MNPNQTTSNTPSIDETVTHTGPVTPRRVPKGWGQELWLHNANDYCCKILDFNRVQARSSLHFHKAKSECWFILSGRFLVEWGSQPHLHSLILNQGDSFDVPALLPHRLTCIFPGSILEASSPHSDSDTFRLEPGDSQK